jgi:hypothetical protein
MNDKKEFWIINVSNRSVCLGDLGVCLQPKQALDLLNIKNFSFTEQQLEESKKSGSLYKKRDKIRALKEKPKFQKQTTKELSKVPMRGRRKVGTKIEEPKYDELLFSDEEFADEMSNIPVCTPNGNVSPTK